MRAKIVRANSTEIADIKSCTYTETVNSETDLRPGCVSSAVIEVIAYGSQSDAPFGGERLTYYQVDDNGTETLIGYFYAEPSIASKNTYSFSAYDIINSLDIDYSAHLNSIQSNFPMTLLALAQDVADYAGVTLATTDFPMYSQSIEAFYADGVTCRDMLGYIAQLACRFVRTNTSEQIVFDWYTVNTSYRVYPEAGSSGDETYVPYKQDGLQYENYEVNYVGAVGIQPVGVEGAAYTYPSEESTVYATDVNGDGNIIIYNLSATDTGVGNVVMTGDVDSYDDNLDGHVEMTTGTNNVLLLTGNVILTNCLQTVYEAFAESIYNIMRALPLYRPSTISLFPEEDPLRAGEIVYVTDIQGVSFATPIMTSRISQDSAMVSSTGGETYSAYSDDLEKAVANLSASLVKISNLKVDWADITQAVIGVLTANSITVKGSFQSGEFDGETTTLITWLYNGFLQFFRGSDTNMLARIGFNQDDSTDNCLHVSSIDNGPGVHIDYFDGQNYLPAYQADFAACYTDDPANIMYNGFCLDGTTCIVSDLNSAKVGAVQLIAIDSSTSNVPTGTNSGFVVSSIESTGSDGRQIAVLDAGTEVYTRYLSSGTWSSWINNNADFVVDQGTSGNWTYRKWNSGISECWGYYDVSSVACTTSTGSLYVTGAISPGWAFPSGVFLSGTYPTVSMTFHSQQGYPAFVWVAASTLADNGATPFRLMRPTSATISGRMEYIYKGRWK